MQKTCTCPPKQYPCKCKWPSSKHTPAKAAVYNTLKLGWVTLQCILQQCWQYWCSKHDHVASQCASLYCNCCSHIQCSTSRGHGTVSVVRICTIARWTQQSTSVCWTQQSTIARWTQHSTSARPARQIWAFGRLSLTPIYTYYVIQVAMSHNCTWNFNVWGIYSVGCFSNKTFWYWHQYLLVYPIPSIPL